MLLRTMFELYLLTAVVAIPPAKPPITKLTACCYVDNFAATTGVGKGAAGIPY